MSNIAFGRTTQATSRPPFVVDPTSVSKDTGRQIAWEDLPADQFAHGSVAITSNGGAAAAATAIPVDPLPVDIPEGTVLRFGAGEYALVTADAAEGDTSLTVEALANAIEDNDVAYYDNSPEITGRHVRAGTVVDLLADGRIVPASLATAGVTAYGILQTNADEDNRTDAATGYGVYTDGFFYENLLPEATGTPKEIDATWKTELLARGGRWMFTQFADNT